MAIQNISLNHLELTVLVQINYAPIWSCNVKLCFEVVGCVSKTLNFLVRKMPRKRVCLPADKIPYPLPIPELLSAVQSQPLFNFEIKSPPIMVSFLDAYW